MQDDGKNMAAVFGVQGLENVGEQFIMVASVLNEFLRTTNAGEEGSWLMHQLLLQSNGLFLEVFVVFNKGKNEHNMEKKSSD